MQHHARRMRQRECSADASLARDEAAARRDALAQKRAKAALMRRDAKAALFRAPLGELRLATAMSALRRAIRADMAVAREICRCARDIWRCRWRLDHGACMSTRQIGSMCQGVHASHACSACPDGIGGRHCHGRRTVPRGQARGAAELPFSTSDLDLKLIRFGT